MAIKIGRLVIMDIKEVWEVGFKLIDVKCQECEERYECLVDREEVEPYQCEKCGEKAATWIPTVVAIRDEKSASFLDGQRKEADPDYQAQLLASKLEVEKLDASPEDRARIDKEIHSLKKLRR